MCCWATSWVRSQMQVIKSYCEWGGLGTEWMLLPHTAASVSSFFVLPTAHEQRKHSVPSLLQPAREWCLVLGSGCIHPPGVVPQCASGFSFSVANDAIALKKHSGCLLLWWCDSGAAKACTRPVHGAGARVLHILSHSRTASHLCAWGTNLDIFVPQVRHSIGAPAVVNDGILEYFMTVMNFIILY